MSKALLDTCKYSDVRPTKNKENINITKAVLDN